MEAIVVKNLTKRYENKTAVSDLCIQVGKGKVFGMLGANGAGKSTTIECMLGTKTADSGSISILGCDPRKDRRTLFQKVGVQFQECDYQPEIKVSELWKRQKKQAAVQALRMPIWLFRERRIMNNESIRSIV